MNNALQSGILFSKTEIETLLKKYSIVPLAQSFSLNFDTSLSVYLKTKSEFLLESAESGESMGRYSFIGKGIYRQFVLRQDSVDDIDIRGTCTTYDGLKNPLEYVQKEMRAYKAPLDETYKFPPFWGGLLGYLGYETVGYYEDIERLYEKPNIEVPEGVLLIPRQLMVVDHLKRMLWVVGIVEDVKDYDRVYEEILQRWKEISLPLADEYLKYNEYALSINIERQDVAHEIMWSTEFSKEEYLEKVKYCKECIHKGDIIQVVFSRALHTEFPRSNHLLFYIHLRNMNPSPYMYYLNFDGFSIIGSSPELLASLSLDKVMEVRPIAGTIRRGSTQQEDEDFKQELMSDEKEKAEHIMLVDLGRNDLHRISKAGTVHVPRYMSIEGYSHVYHIVSTVRGIIEDGKDGFDLIKATFPAGTLSGAPKIEAMNIIGRIEPSARNIYGGLIMVMGFNGYLDSCIAIRTAVLKDDKIYLRAGGGLVADSNPEKEWKETELKLGALIQTVRDVLAYNDKREDERSHE